MQLKKTTTPKELGCLFHFGYLVTDPCGYWWFFQKRPTLCITGWKSEMSQPSCKVFLFKTPPNPHWRSLIWKLYSTPPGFS